jgi:hypothetical protein
MLFVDDGDVAWIHNLTRVIHCARKQEGKPVVVPEHRWEEDPNGGPFLGGTVRLEPNRGYRMWYQSFVRSSMLSLYAESADGIHWTRPILGRHADWSGDWQNNILFSQSALRPDSLSPYRTYHEHNHSVLFTPHLGPERTYTLLSYDYGTSGCAAYHGFVLAFSPDGLLWTDASNEPVIPAHSDVGWFTFDEVDRKFRGIVRSANGQLHIRGNWRRPLLWTESWDGYEWLLPQPAILPDLRDEEWTQGRPGCHTQFYGMPIARYESLLLGLLQVFRVTRWGRNQDGEIDVQLACSRDGRQWSRVGDRRAILELGPEGAWDCGMVLTGNSLVRDGDRVRLYYTGWNISHEPVDNRNGQYRIGMAWWPRDRMVGLSARGQIGELETKLHVAGARLHVNADATGGQVAAEIVGQDGWPIEGYRASDCEALSEDALDHTFRWRNPLSHLGGRPVAVRLRLANAEAFSLWWD